MSGGIERLIQILIDCGALRFGDFTLKSGKKSPFFMDLGQVSKSDDLTTLGQALAETAYVNFGEIDIFFGPAYKGIVLATIAALAYEKQYGKRLDICYDRKEAKSHGEGGKLIGKSPKPGDRVVIVDDVMSSGGTKIDAVRAMEACGVRPIGIVIALDRTQRGFEPSAYNLPPVVSVTDLSDLARCVEDRDPNRALEIRTFYEGE